MITHIVLFKLKDRSPEAIEACRAELAGLEAKIDVIRSFQLGKDVIRADRSYDLGAVRISKFIF